MKNEKINFKEQGLLFKILYIISAIIPLLSIIMLIVTGRIPYIYVTAIFIIIFNIMNFVMLVRKNNEIKKFFAFLFYLLANPPHKAPIISIPIMNFTLDNTTSR